MLILKIIYVIFIGIYAISTSKKCKSEYEKGIIFLLFTIALNTIRI